MKADAGPDGDDRAERERLRAALRHWAVPAAPAGIEDALRREFRRRRARRRLAVWLPLAAGLGALAAWPLLVRGPVRSPAAPTTPVTSTEASAVPTTELTPAAPSPKTSPAAGIRAARRGAEPRAKEPAVLVEASQAELLAEFGRRAWETPEAAPGGGMPELHAGEAEAYRGEWEEVAGEWPAVQVVAPKSGR